MRILAFVALALVFVGCGVEKQGVSNIAAGAEVGVEVKKKL